MVETACLSLGLGIFRDWIDVPGNLRTSQNSVAFRGALIVGAQWILETHGMAHNPGLFPLSRMDVAPLMGLHPDIVKRCIPVWIRSGLLRRMSALIRRCHAPEGLY